MNCIIIDDDATARLITRKLCLKSEQINIVKEFSSAIDAIKFLNTTNVDLVYLDIHMPTFTGFDFIKTIKNPPKIVLITTDKNLALEAFEFKSVVDYLVKPITKARFDTSLEKLKSIMNIETTIPKVKSKPDFIFVYIDRRLVKVSIASIYLIEAKGDYINIKTAEKNYIVHSTLKKIVEKLPEELFFKVHRSFIINISKIIDIEDNTVLIHKDVVPVSRTHKSELMTRLNLL